MTQARGHWSFASPVDVEGGPRSLMSPDPELAAPDMTPVPRKPTEYDMPTVAGLSVEQQRERRSKGLDVHYDERFDLADEVAFFTDPLAAAASEIFAAGRFVVPVSCETLTRIEGQPSRRLVFLDEVERFAEAVHVARRAALSMLGHDDGLPAEAREALRSAASVSAPQISDEDVETGVWRDVLVGYVAPVAPHLAALLGRSPSPGMVHASAVSDDLRHDVLAPLGTAALYADRRAREVLGQFRRGRTAQRHAEAERAKRDRQQRAAELARMGLQ